MRLTIEQYLQRIRERNPQPGVTNVVTPASLPPGPQAPGAAATVTQPDAPPVDQSTAIAEAAKNYYGTSTSNGPDGGRNACVYAVNQVLKQVNITPPWGNQNSVPAAKASLSSSNSTPLEKPEPGAIVLMGPDRHMGIVMPDGKTIISNSTSRAAFSWKGSVVSYTEYYGNLVYYRLNNPATIN
jgi:hypothetical protein